MKNFNKLMLKEIANNLMFDMDDKQYDSLLKEFDVILKQISLISEVPGVDDASPMVFPYEENFSYLREDVSSEPLSQEDALRNASEVKKGQIRLPKVVK